MRVAGRWDERGLTTKRIPNPLAVLLLEDRSLAFLLVQVLGVVFRAPDDETPESRLVVVEGLAVWVVEVRVLVDVAVDHAVCIGVAAESDVDGRDGGGGGDGQEGELEAVDHFGGCGCFGGDLVGRC